MNDVSGERLLVHGPYLQDLTDLLLFDRIVFPATTAIRRPRDLPPGYAGYPVEEPLPEGIRERLAEAGLLLTPGQILFATPISELDTKLLEDADALTQWFQRSGLEMSKVAAELAFTFLDTPASGSEVAAWMQEIDGKTRHLADIAFQRGWRAIPKLYASDVTATLKPGWSLVLSVTFPQFPGVQTGRVDLDDLLAFLTDDVTKEKRRALFDWPLGIEAAVEEGQITFEEIPHHVADLLRDYTDWILASGLSSSTVVTEFLVVCGDRFVQALSGVEGGETRQTLAFAPRGLWLEDTSQARAGRELAYLSHRLRGYT